MEGTLPEHAVIRPLTFEDVDQIESVENASFENVNHRCTREKLLYRLRVCPELCCGVFMREFQPQPLIPASSGSTDQSSSNSASPEDPTSASGVISGLIGLRSREPFKQIYEWKNSLVEEKLVAHVLATKSNDEFVTDESMMIPESEHTKNQDKSIGHCESGQTIFIHSLCVAPKWQGRRIGSKLLRDYLQRMSTQQVASRLAILCQEDLIGFYSRCGFKNHGPSSVQYGGGNWFNMAIQLDSLDSD